MRNINLCDTVGCGEIFRTYYCKRCKEFQDNYCKKCHESYIGEIKRMKQLAKLKRDFHV